MSRRSDDVTRRKKQRRQSSNDRKRRGVAGDYCSQCGARIAGDGLVRWCPKHGAVGPRT